ncbi:glycine oxidase ThiO [Amycolatopsis sp. 195334CR]|uniref:glycine oxidase ThiO n=1 Tax=Amycolatopsis sp. 195334CR TaxID=2814588 RepID=UPI001A8E0FD7|nr:glycine oxidase ThiO [Amycolatopsis sp. 195334CR]MBN6034956.1 glycine oxidase ThiO [Amycolatopsis sp. 195334CR]
MKRKHRVTVVGGGVVGLAVAWRVKTRGHEVELVDPWPKTGASWVAGGMLAPVTEAWPGEEEVLTLGEESLRRWPRFAAGLGGCGLSEKGTLVAALDSADLGVLDQLAAYLHHVGREAEKLTSRQLRQREPGLAGSIRGGLSVPGDLSVDNRALLDALARHLDPIREEVVELGPETVRTTGRTLTSDLVVLAAGAWSARLHPALETAVRPLKGEILRLRARRTTLGPPAHTVRAYAEGRPIYLVPRAGGELVLGATQYEAGFDEVVTARGVRELLEGAERVFPAIAEYELAETAAGLRAASVDNLPFIGRLPDGVFAATGHHRNGLLMAPITADAVLAALDGAPAPPGVAAADPARLREKESV